MRRRHRGLGKESFRRTLANLCKHWTGQKLDLTTWKDEVSFLTWVVTAFSTVTWFLTAVLVAIIAVGIMNTLWNSVRERTAEIGTMRAIGMARWRVLVMIELEALILGLFATGTGAAFGTFFAMGIDALKVRVPVKAMATILLSDTLHLAVSPSTVFVAVLFLSSLTALAAFLPALRAATLRPVTAMQHIE